MFLAKGLELNIRSDTPFVLGLQPTDLALTGPILLCPPPIFYSIPRPSLVLACPLM